MYPTIEAFWNAHRWLNATGIRIKDVLLALSTGYSGVLGRELDMAQFRLAMKNGSARCPLGPTPGTVIGYVDMKQFRVMIATGRVNGTIPTLPL